MAHNDDDGRFSWQKAQQDVLRSHVANLKQNNDATPHGWTPDQIEAINARLEASLPKLASADPEVQRSLILEEEYRKIGATPSPFHRRGSSGYVPGATNPGAGVQVSPPLPYQPEFSSPDRQQYPVHRVLANRYWRLFHKLDPVIGTVIDMFSEMPWSEFQLKGEGVNGAVKDHFELMCEETKLLSLLPYITREFLVVGEAVPHTMYDADAGMWNYITLHNPDAIEVIDAPFIKMPPIVELIPDQRLRQILMSSDPQLQKVRAQMPSELVGKILARQNIPLDDLNCTFLPRKLHWYDTRGTSIISRMWRVLLLEDAIFSVTIATARRHASPLKIAKLGNPQTGWIPGPEHERRLLELLAQAELDPHAFLVYHFGVQFEAFGTTERAISVGKEWEVLERIKTVALGVSKAFLSGEVSYASSAAGLQVFLQRLKALREHFQSQWIYPKFFKPISEINQFIRPTKAELSHRIRVKRTARELAENRRYIVPEISWNKSLDPNIDRETIAAYQALNQMGVKISNKSLFATVGLKYEDELTESINEQKQEVIQRQKAAPVLGPAALGPAGQEESDQKVQNFTPLAPAPGPGQPGGPPAYAPPPRPGVPPQQQPGMQPAPMQPQQASPVRTPMPDLSQVQPPPPKRLKGKMWERADSYGNWSIDEAEGAVNLFKDGSSDETFWQSACSDTMRAAFERGDLEDAWEDMELYLGQQGYSEEEISDLRDILVSEWVLKPKAEDFARGLFKSLPDDLGTDLEAEETLHRVFNNKNPAQISASPYLLVGSASPTHFVEGDDTVQNPFRIKK